MSCFAAAEYTASVCVTASIRGALHEHTCARPQCCLVTGVDVQAWYLGTIWGQQAAAKYDWGLLVVLIAVELGKQRIEDLTGGTEPIKVQLSLVLERCRAVQLSGLRQRLETFIGRAGWL